MIQLPDGSWVAAMEITMIEVCDDEVLIHIGMLERVVAIACEGDANAVRDKIAKQVNEKHVW